MKNLEEYPHRHFKIVYADCPWSFRTWSNKGQGKSATQHYNCMSLDDICNLPVNKITQDDSVLFLWVVQSMLPEAMKVLDAWGFTFKTVAFCWIKMPKSWRLGDKRIEPRMGLGYHTRSGMEQCWLAIKGNGYKKVSSSVSQVLHSPLRQHSRKPDEFADSIVNLCGDLPRIELFARETRIGWESWGNEVEKFRDLYNLETYII